MNNVTELLNNYLVKIAGELDISESDYQRAVTSYKAVGDYIDNCAPEFNICIFPQGSFNLGTVIKPLTDKDEYDLDLICEFKNVSDLEAKEIKGNVGVWLSKSKRYSNKLVEKKRCWTIEYADSAQFSMDITPGIPQSYNAELINVTDKVSEGVYTYSPSNPKGYGLWFYKQMEVRHKQIRKAIALKENAEVEKVPNFRVKTPLQQAVQILKRHRDILYNLDPNKIKPISIIITTLAARAYGNEDNLYECLINILNSMPRFIKKTSDGKFLIENPSSPGENFAEKWNEDGRKAKAFDYWCSKAKEDFIAMPTQFLTQVEVAESLKKSLGGEIVTRAVKVIGEQQRQAIKDKKIGVDPVTGILFGGGIVPPPHRNYGKK